MGHKVLYQHIMEGVWGVEKYNPLPTNGVTFARAGGAKINMRKLSAKPNKYQRKAAFAKIVAQNKGN